MINTFEVSLAEATPSEPFEDRIDILYHELELATRWQCPSLLIAVYSSEFVHNDAERALENRLIRMGQRARHIVVKSQEDADIPMLISEQSDLNNVVVFVEGLRWGCVENDFNPYQVLNKHREFFIENRVRVVFWLTESEAIHMAHHAPDYWTFRHRVIEFVDSPRPEQIQPTVVETCWQGAGDAACTSEEIDDRITLRAALLSDLPDGEESTEARTNLLLTLGILHWRRGDFDQAAQFLVTALQLAAKLQDPKLEAQIHNALALVESATGRYQQAIKAYQKAAQLAPEQINPWNNLGNLHSKLEQYEDALEAYKKAVEKDPNDRVSWVGLADSQYQLGKHEEAVFAYKKALRFSPKDAHCWKNLADICVEEGELDQAFDGYHKALGIDRSLAEAWTGLGKIFGMQGKKEEAVRAFQEAIQAAPQNAAAWEGLGDLHFAAGESEQAMQAYEKATELDQAIGASHSRLASIFFQGGNYAKAVPLLKRAVETEAAPEKARELWNQLGDAYRKLNDYENAMAAYRQADGAAGFKERRGQPQQTVPAEPEPEVAAEAVEVVEESIAATPEENNAAVEDDGGSKAEPEAAIDPAVEASQELASMMDDSATMESESDVDFIRWLESLSARLPEAAPVETPAVEPIYAEETVEMQAAEPEKAEEAEEPYFSRPQVDSPEFIAALKAEGIGDQPGKEPYFKTEMVEDPQVDPAPAEEPKQDTELADALKEVAARLPKAEEAQPAAQAAQPVATEVKKEAGGDSTSARIWNELGNIYYNIVAYDEAISALKKALELDQAYSWTYNNLASIYIHKGDYAEAIPVLQKGIPLMRAPQDQALLWNRLGDTYRHLDQQDKAAEAYQKAIELSPENVSLLTRARLSLLGNGRQQ